MGGLWGPDTLSGCVPKFGPPRFTTKPFSLTRVGDISHDTILLLILSRDCGRWSSDEVKQNSATHAIRSNYFVDSATRCATSTSAATPIYFPKKALLQLVGHHPDVFARIVLANLIAEQPRHL